MGPLEKWAEQEIKNFKKEVVKSLQPRLEEACRSATREIREKVTDVWFRQWNGTHTKEATQYEVSSSIDGDTLHCTVNTYVDSGAYGGASRARKYLDDHPEYPELKDPANWVLSKFHDEGIIGLPKESTVTDWVNSSFHQFNTLTEEMQINVLWKSFESKVASRL